jgi:hypothetical protein
MGRWISVTQIARIYRRSPVTIRKWCYDGTIYYCCTRAQIDFRGRWWLHVLDENTAPFAIPTPRTVDTPAS